VPLRDRARIGDTTVGAGVSAKEIRLSILGHLLRCSITRPLG
jgi:hypothetical protein